MHCVACFLFIFSSFSSDWSKYHGPREQNFLVYIALCPQQLRLLRIDLPFVFVSSLVFEPFSHHFVILLLAW